MLQHIIVPIHREGWPFIAIFAAVTFIFALISSTLGFIGIILTTWCAYFFRDPERVTPAKEGLVVSPADGIITQIEKVAPPEELDMPEKVYTRVSIFLSVFDVHVNRTPCAGVIKKIWYFPGAFVNASLDKSSELNERQAFKLELPNGTDIAFVQIAGLIARRIVTSAKEGDSMQTGERFGIIRFGSRVDVYLPTNIAIHVIKGQRMVGGESVIANIFEKGEDYKGEIR